MPRWDSTGWTLLGTQTVNGRTDRDVIMVSKRARWDKLTMVVEDSDLILLEFTVEFANGERWSPKLRYEFREGQRTRAIDLPGDDRHIAKIELLYKNTRGGGNARVAIYGKDVRGAHHEPAPPPPPPPPPPPRPEWSPAGWTLLGSQTVQGKRDKDRFVVGRKAGKFDRITVVVKDSDIEMLDFVVTFENGTKFEPKIRHRFHENERTRAIDLPGNDRYIKHIDVKYANLPGGGRARVEIYAKDTHNAPPPPPPPPRPEWSPAGWTLLGSQTVQGKRDKDRFVVGRKAGKFDRITVVVKDSDIEMLDFVVTFENGTKFEPKIRHRFRENERTRAIDLPGNDRYIKHIDVKYANLPGGGRARVEIYAKDTRNTPPPPPPAGGGDSGFDANGWTLLGSQTVEGRRDKDVYPVGRAKGRFDRIVVVVKDSDLDMLDFVITFENNTTWDPKLRHTFKQGARSRQIDLPGSDRYIKQINVKYANLPGGGKARVEIYGKDTKEGKDPRRKK